MSTALYRRYRPESFADVIGQEHVTEPLMQALRSGRVNHAYLFSGPRGCGKTTSARILARCLNCEQGPTDTPCGTCDSCEALARDGAGSVDVIEIDAASHGGVDDARDLRERAAFGPAQSRYKVYIIDEAHMVTPNGFNALLKVVEEPPPHVKFIFATTEPEKVLATIRSRTHHYPFHLVPPQRLTGYLEELCEQEDVRLEPGVLSFVTRSGGGSVRDSLSVLDQLMSGAGEEGLTYERTAALLGFTDVELLDAVVDAVAAGDAATVFQQVDKVMESGHDPRRFVEDLLERYRDLIVLTAVGEQAGGLLPGLPPDQIDRMRQQAQSYGPSALSHAADLVAHGLSEMAGAVSYRLMLELLAARLLLPAATGEEGYAARLDRIERRLNAAPADAPGDAPEPAAAAGRVRGQGGRQHGAQQQDRRQQDGQQQGGQQQGGQQDGRQQAGRQPGSDGGPERGQMPQPGAEAGPGDLDTAALRRHWPEIIEAVRAISRRTAGGLQQAQVLDFDGRRLLLGLPDENWVRHFTGTSHEEALRQGVLDALALSTRIEATVQGHGGAGEQGGQGGQGPSGPGSSGPPRPGGPAGPAGPGGSPGPSGPGASPGPADTPGPPGPDQGGAPTQAGAPVHGGAPTQAGAPVHGGAPTQAGAPTQGGPVQGAPAIPGGDQLPQGQIRTRGIQAGAPPTESTLGGRPQPVRVRGRGSGAGGRAGGHNDSPGPDRAGGPTPEPSLAEQLGAGGRASGEAGPDWTQTARTSSAPDWATADAPPAAGSQAGSAVPAASGTTASRTTARPATADPATGAGAPTRASTSATAPPAPDAGTHREWAEPSADDEDLTTSGAVGQPVIETVLGGTVIAINDDPVG